MHGIRPDIQQRALQALQGGTLRVENNEIVYLNGVPRLPRTPQSRVSIGLGSGQERVTIPASHVVWINAHGLIPAGYVLRLKDGVPSHHALSNLECLHNLQVSWESALKRTARNRAVRARLDALDQDFLPVTLADLRRKPQTHDWKRPGELAAFNEELGRLIGEALKETLPGLPTRFLGDRADLARLLGLVHEAGYVAGFGAAFQGQEARYTRAGGLLAQFQHGRGQGLRLGPPSPVSEAELADLLAERDTALSQVAALQRRGEAGRKHWALIAHFTEGVRRRVGVHLTAADAALLSARLQRGPFDFLMDSGAPAARLVLEEREVFGVFTPDDTGTLTLTTAYTSRMLSADEGTLAEQSRQRGGPGHD